jgi:6-phosphogluconolactonase (cycloisomerase 2 family)
MFLLFTIVVANGCGSGSSRSGNAPMANAGGGTTGTGGVGSVSSTPGGGTVGGTGGAALLSFAYVGKNVGGAQKLGGRIAGYSVGSDGAPRLMSGSPFSFPGGASLGLLPDAGGQILFGSDFADVSSYTIQSDGSLEQVNNLQGIFGSELSRAGNTLYPLQVNVGGTNSNAFAFLNVGSDGVLTMTGSLPVGVGGRPLFFTPDLQRAYEPFCFHLAAGIQGFNRNPGGTLTLFNPQATLPLDSSGQPACPEAMAISPDGRFLVAGLNAFSGVSAGIGVYMINIGGTLTAVSGSPFPTRATYSYAAFDPTGTFIAFAESDGVAVYRFNGTAPPVLMSGSPAGGTSMDQIAFNQAGNLLFSVNNNSGKLFVFTFRNGTILPGTGSPLSPGFTFTAPNSLAVVH